MDSRGVDNLLSDNEGESESTVPLLVYTNKFYEVFPYYLAIGMTYEQFWEMDCMLVKSYRKAAEIKQKLENQQRWLQGYYVYEAILDASPILQAFAKRGTKPQPYRKEPIPLFSSEPEEKEKREDASDNKAKAFFEIFARTHNAKYNKGGEVKNG